MSDVHANHRQRAPKLTAPQERALAAARAGQLRHARTSWGTPDYWVNNVAPMAAATVREATVEALITRGLLKRPVPGDTFVKAVDV